MADEAAKLAEEQAIEMFKVKKLITSLEKAKGFVMCRSDTPVLCADTDQVFLAIAETEHP